MKKLKNRKTGDKWLIGIDEVGRGPLAGPVTVGAVAVKIGGSVAKTYKILRKKLMEISCEIEARKRTGSKKEYPIGVDSKKMKESDREFWYKVIRKLMNDGSLIAFTSSSSAKEIDKKGIAVCIKELINKNLNKISKNSKHDPDVTYEKFEQMEVLFDGGLKTELPVGSQKTITKGDEKELLISLASVYAKVTRDTHMKKLSKNSKYSVYEFNVHKGYGTLKHRLAIRKLGPSDEHRKSFCKNIMGGHMLISVKKLAKNKID